MSEKKPKKSPLVIIFVTVFVDLVGFGIIIPLSPYLAREFGANPFHVGALGAIYSFMQFVMAPFWGQLSDRFGRRPIILVSLLGAALSYFAFALASTLWVLFLARAFAGFFAANISTASAYIADVTSAQNRSKNMGLIGAAFGIGFVIGPFLGGLLAQLGESLGDQPPLGQSFSAIGAGAICFLNFIAAIFALPESLPKERRQNRKRPPRVKAALDLMARPILGPLVWVTFLTVTAMGFMEYMLFLFVDDVFDWSVAKASYAFAYVGVMIAFTQGYLVRKVLPKWGERKLLKFSLILFFLGMAGIGFSFSVPLMAITCTLLALGNGLTNPPLLGGISLVAKEKEQGSVMGVNQSMASLGRILGPLLGGFCYGNFGRSIPFLTAACLIFLAWLIVLKIAPKIPSRAESGT